MATSGGGAEGAAPPESPEPQEEVRNGLQPGQRPQDFSRLKVIVDSAKLDPGSYSHSGLKLLGSKPNLYVELSVDGKPSRKTEFCRATYQPKWNADFPVVATPYSKVRQCASISRKKLISALY